MKLSVVIPCYNAENYIRRCLDSILPKADPGEVEVILIDDGSRDSTPDILKEYVAAHPNVKAVSQSNSGPATARNKGVGIARGEYVWFVDADDFLTEDAFEVLLPRLAEGYDIITFNHIKNEADGLHNVSTFTESNIDAAEMILQGHLYACNRVIRKSFFDKVRLPEGLINIEDLVFNLSITPYVERVLTLPDHIYVYERTNASATSKNLAKRHLIRIHRDTMTAHRMLLDNFENIPEGSLKEAYRRVLNKSFSGCILSLLRHYNCRMVRDTIATYSSWGVYPFGYGGSRRLKALTFLINHRPFWALYPLLKKFL